MNPYGEKNVVNSEGKGGFNVHNFGTVSNQAVKTNGVFQKLKNLNKIEVHNNQQFGNTLSLKEILSPNFNMVGSSMCNKNGEQKVSENRFAGCNFGNAFKINQGIATS